jgi:PAS domain S-box-containing protein
MSTKLELFQKVTSLTHLGIWERNLEKNEVYWNSVVREIYEVGPDYYHDPEKSMESYSDVTAIRKLINDAITTGEPGTGDLQLTTVSGNIKWVKVYIRAGFEDGKCTVIYGTIEDITAQVNLINTLAEQQEQFHHAFDYAPIGMALVSTRGEWIRVNKMLCQMLGREEQQLLKETFQDITHPDDLNTDLQQMHRLLDGQITSYQMDKRYFHNNGSIIWASLHVTLVRNPQGGYCISFPRSRT